MVSCNNIEENDIPVKLVPYRRQVARIGARPGIRCCVGGGLGCHCEWDKDGGVSLCQTHSSHSGWDLMRPGVQRDLWEEKKRESCAGGECASKLRRATV